MSRKSNFDFLEKIDVELFEVIEDAQKLFRDSYFNQCVIQLRIFGEKISKKILGNQNPEMTFDDILNCIKDKAKEQRSKELVEDLFFIKKQGNLCAHGEDITPEIVLEAIKRTFEIALNYTWMIKRDEKTDKLRFDDDLFMTQKENKNNEEKLIDKYLKRATQEKEEKEISKEELLNLKQGEFNSKVEKKQDEIKDESFVNDVSQYKNKKKRKPLNPEKQAIKDKIKNAKKNLKNNINFEEKKSSKKVFKKQTKNSTKKNKNYSKNVLFETLIFLIFFFISLFLILKIIINF